MITLLAASVVGTGVYLMSVFEPDLRLIDILTEVTSAFGTVGLSTGITPNLTDASKLLSIPDYVYRPAGTADCCLALVFLQQW